MLPGMRAARRIGGGLREFLPVALCALAGHFALYGSLVPSSGGHAYFVWYEPVVAGLSILALMLLVGLLLAVMVGRDGLRRRVVPVLLPGAARSSPGSVRTVRLALASVAFLACQETIERSLSEGSLGAAQFAPHQLMLVLVVVAAAAAVVALVERSCSELIALVARPFARRRERDTGVSFPSERPAVRRRNPLAQLRGLRAPPPLSV
jgi:hypothetical protein